jgi:hypothetical protein
LKERKINEICKGLKQYGITIDEFIEGAKKYCGED